MANNPPPEGASDDFFEHILANPSYYVNDTSSAVNNGNFPGTVSSTMGLQLSSGDEGGFQALGLRLEQSTNGFRQEGEPVQLTNLFPAFGHNIQAHSIRPTAPQAFQSSHGQPTSGTVSNVTHPPMFRPRVRARRGQATDPHSIAERLRRERIAERMKALQELVPSFNKTDKAAMLDEVVDYVKFLRLQVKVLSMSRLGGAGAVAQLVADVPLPSVEVEDGEDASNLTDKWSTKDAEQQVAKLMEKDVGSAMQFLQSKALCIMPISLAAAIYPIYQSEASALVKPELNTPS